MKKINGIMLSTVPPLSTEVLWINNGEIKYFDNGTWQKLKYYIEDENQLEEPVEVKPYVELSVGDSEEVKELNLSVLPFGLFLVHIGSGIGVGTFTPSLGGKAHITTAEGHEVFYDIHSDGEIYSILGYSKPNEPMEIIIDEEIIGDADGVDDALAAKIESCGRIVVMRTTTYGEDTYTYPIIYTRVDSTATDHIDFINVGVEENSVLVFELSAHYLFFG